MAHGGTNADRKIQEGIHRWQSVELRRFKMKKADDKKAPVSEEDGDEFLAAHRVRPGQRRRVIADEKRNESINTTGALWGVRN
jgi:hypothetical protein